MCRRFGSRQGRWSVPQTILFGGIIDMMRSAIGFGMVVATVLTTTAWAQAQDRDKNQENKRYGTYEFVSGRNADGEFSRDQLSGTVKGHCRIGRCLRLTVQSWT
jgi:hypothetical protein